MRRCLVVANQTLGGDPLLEEVTERARAGVGAFHVVVPATPPHSFATWTEGEALAVADERLHQALRRFKEAGLDATGEVGDPNPLDAVADAWREGDFAEIIVSTLSPGLSRWLRQDLPHRLERRYTVPVTHVVAES